MTSEPTAIPCGEFEQKVEMRVCIDFRFVVECPFSQKSEFASVAKAKAKTLAAIATDELVTKIKFILHLTCATPKRIMYLNARLNGRARLQKRCLIYLKCMYVSHEHIRTLFSPQNIVLCLKFALEI